MITKTLRPGKDKIVDIFDTDKPTRTISGDALKEEKDSLESRLVTVNEDLAIIATEVAKE